MNVFVVVIAHNYIAHCNVTPILYILREVGYSCPGQQVYNAVAKQVKRIYTVGDVMHGEDSEGIVEDKGQRMLAPLFKLRRGKRPVFQCQTMAHRGGA